jgi:signal transduction histidine kinase
MMRISVEDQGPGIPPEQRARLFERFYRARANSDVPGVGLGLAIAKGIVEAHGGRMGVESTLGEGTQVWFTLPVPRRQHADPAR